MGSSLAGERALHSLGGSWSTGVVCCDRFSLSPEHRPLFSRLYLYIPSKRSRMGQSPVSHLFIYFLADLRPGESCLFPRCLAQAKGAFEHRSSLDALAVARTNQRRLFFCRDCQDFARL